MVMKKIAIISSSVSLRIRPPSLKKGRTYGEIIEDNEQDFQVTNLGLTRLLSTELKRNKDLYIRIFPDYYIINIGCVDAPPREIPEWLSDIVFERKYYYLYPFINYLYTKVIKRYLRRYLLKLRFSRSWTTEKKFKQSMIDILNIFRKETNAEVILVGINKGNERLETLLPGVMIKYERYNEILKEIACEEKIKFIDVSVLESVDYFPDGVHYNDAGHVYIANAILKEIKNYESG